MTRQRARTPVPRSPPGALPTSLPAPLVFAGPAHRKPVMQSHEQASGGHTIGSHAVMSLFDGPAYSGRHSYERRPLSGLVEPSRTSSDSTRRHAQTARQMPLAVGAGAVAASALTFAVANS
ncbi:hypothetical protein MIND_00641300 [Mycena indigotica]|uniref:Uncharacterized protein n=1 Tax=Mycena indigotica TaxID=2126181 RepID=A0A8H6W741_9AGAR|nr:uncharacterized protein MIND_00641300 [Mycena indigotica]KAF7304098.1 hypothetical protein MIND_00641300 [Mycena indigotica]